MQAVVPGCVQVQTVPLACHCHNFRVVLGFVFMLVVCVFLFLRYNLLVLCQGCDDLAGKLGATSFWLSLCHCWGWDWPLVYSGCWSIGGWASDISFLYQRFCWSKRSWGWSHCWGWGRPLVYSSCWAISSWSSYILLIEFNS